MAAPLPSSSPGASCHQAPPASALHVTVHSGEARPQPAQGWGSASTLLRPAGQGLWPHGARLGGMLVPGHSSPLEAGGGADIADQPRLSPHRPRQGPGVICDTGSRCPLHGLEVRQACRPRQGLVPPLPRESLGPGLLLVLQGLGCGSQSPSVGADLRSKGRGAQVAPPRAQSLPALSQLDQNQLRFPGSPAVNPSRDRPAPGGQAGLSNASPGPPRAQGARNPWGQGLAPASAPTRQPGTAGSTTAGLRVPA